MTRPGHEILASQPEVTRALENKDGKKIEAELLGKQGDTVIVLVRGRRYELKINSLSKKDQDFLANWHPGT